MSSRALALCVLVSCSILAPSVPPAHAAAIVRDRAQNVVNTVGAGGVKVAQLPGSASSRYVDTPDGTPGALEPGVREVGSPPPCVPSTAQPEPGFYQLRSRHPGWTVDACGRVRAESGFAGPLPAIANGLVGPSLALSQDALFLQEIPEVTATMIFFAHKFCKYCFLRFFAKSSSSCGVFCCFLMKP